MTDGEINENASAKVQLAFAAKVIGLVGTLVWGYSVVVNRLNTIENDIIRMHHEMELNSNFRYTWPREGELPADVMQNMNIELIKERLSKIDEKLDELRDEKNGG